MGAGKNAVFSDGEEGSMRAYIKGIAVFLFWMLVWQAISLAVANPVLLCGPLDVLMTLASDIASGPFWYSIIYSFVRIAIGFICALISGILLGVAAWHIPVFAALFNPAVQFIKSVPVACFIVLLLIWFGSSYVSAIAVFLVVFPAFYFSVTEGLASHNVQIREMLDVFRVPLRKRVFAFHWPTILPFLIASSRIAVGMSWKAGVAAELIGLSAGSIGEHIYQAKITLSSADLFAWTLAIVFVSMLCERVFLVFLRKSEDWAWCLALFGRRSAKKDSLRNSKLGQGGSGGVRPEHDLVRIVDASKEYGGEAVADCFSITIAPGDRLALRGPSGSGKTTVLRMMAGLVQPDSGLIESDAAVSMVFQETRMFETRNAIENVLLAAGGSFDQVSAERILCELLPSGALGKPVSQLSGGMRRRVELARALAADSDLVILDEPFTGLDEDTRRASQRVILLHLDGRALVVASHDSQDFIALGIEKGMVIDGGDGNWTLDAPSGSERPSYVVLYPGKPFDTADS